jgi:hypothetical protein
MSSEHILTASPPAGRPQFSGAKALVFLPGAAVFGALVGGAASVAQDWFAPLLFFPLLVGVVLGAVLVTLLRTTQTAHRATLIVGVLLALSTATVAQHYVAYRVWAHRVDANPKAQLARAAFGDRLPDSFFQFLRREASSGRTLLGGKLWPELVARGPWAWASWGADGLLVLAGALAIVLPALGLPYCRHCQTWYRTTRSGRLRQLFAQRLAEMFHLSLPERLKKVRYRLLSCEGGCEPTGLEFIWRRRRADSRTAMVWLTDHGRNAVQHVLDEARASRTQPKS